jgi:hypothetical protein
VGCVQDVANSSDAGISRQNIKRLWFWYASLPISQVYDTYRVSYELRSLLRESVPYVKLYRYNPKHLYPKLNGYEDNGQRNVWASGVST